MKKLLLLLVLVSFTALDTTAQDDLFGAQKLPARKGFIIGVNGNFDIPAADMADRFGASYRIGGQVLYKLKSNWVVGPKVDFILGDRIREDSLMSNIRDEYGNFLNQDGEKMGVATFQRGYMIGLQVGKIINLSKTSSDNGILVMTSVGFMQHKINIFDRDKTIPQLRGDYLKGYDRLTNGLFVEQFVGYTYFANNGLVNFNIGLDIAAGFTKLRRDYQYDLMRGDNSSRLDILFGIRGGWYIPIFKRKSEEFFF
ncbi:MAG: hypothetical protein R2800_05390 [Flavipsychrobacter sp.]